MPYTITEYTKKQAKKYNVNVKPSTTKGKKLDVIKDGVKIATIGDINYNDYPTYLEMEKQGIIKKGYANERRKMYKIRHKKDINKGDGFWADKLLW